MQVNLKRLKPLGVIIILGAAILALITCFTADMGVPPKYEPAHDAEYYLQSPEAMNELIAELEENVLPALGGIKSCSLDETTGKVAVYVTAKEKSRVEAVLSRDLDERLFEVIAAG